MCSQETQRSIDLLEISPPSGASSRKLYVKSGVQREEPTGHREVYIKPRDLGVDEMSSEKALFLSTLIVRKPIKSRSLVVEGGEDTSTYNESKGK